MTTTLDASNLRLEDVQRLWKFEEQLNDLIISLLCLNSLTEFEQQELSQIRNLFRSYYAAGKISEGQIKFLFLALISCTILNKVRETGFINHKLRVSALHIRNKPGIRAVVQDVSRRVSVSEALAGTPISAVARDERQDRDSACRQTSLSVYS